MGIRAKISGILLVISGFTHQIQIFVYPHETSAIGAGLFGVVYLILGILLLRKKRSAVIYAAIIPTIGGTLGIVRFFFLHTNPFSIFHVFLDLIIVPLCFKEYRSLNKDDL